MGNKVRALLVLLLCSACGKFETTPTTSNLSSTGVQKNIEMIKVAVTGQASVAKVEIYIDGKLLCTLQQSPYECAWTVDGSAGQRVSISAKAYDTSGRSSVSSVSSVTLQ